MVGQGAPLHVQTVRCLAKGGATNMHDASGRKKQAGLQTRAGPSGDTTTCCWHRACLPTQPRLT